MGFTESSHTGSKKGEINFHKPHPEKKFDHVMCFGTFDIFHPGHIFYLSEAEKFAKKMTIVIARDHRVQEIKGKKPKDNEEIRKKNVAHTFGKANTILGDEKDIFAPIRTLAPDILVFGYDQRVPEEKIHKLFPNIEIRRIEGFQTEKWKSSLLRKE